MGCKLSVSVVHPEKFIKDLLSPAVNKKKKTQFQNTSPMVVTKTITEEAEDKIDNENIPERTTSNSSFETMFIDSF